MIKQPTGWNEAKTLKIGATVTGFPITVKNVNGTVVSEILRHSWIYEYVEGDLVEEEAKKPTPRNLRLRGSW